MITSLFADHIFGEESNSFDVHANELFCIASTIVTALDKKIDNQEQNRVVAPATKQTLLMLLHVFILPKIKFREHDLGSIRDVSSLINTQQDEIKNKISQKELLRTKALKSIESQLISLLKDHDFSSLRYVASCNYDFLKEFLNQLERDIALSNEVMVTLETEISPLRSCTSENDLQTLACLRSTRADRLAHFNETVVARETIKNVISRRHVDKKYLSTKSTVHSNHIVFMETTCRFASVSEQLNDLKDDINKLSSIQEALVQIEAEIVKYKESCGQFKPISSFKINNQTETDEWSDLSKKVNSLVTSKTLPFKDKHKKFCKNVVSKCQRLKSKPKSTFYYELINSESSGDIPGEILTFSPDILHSYGNEPNAALHGICCEVMQHIWRMTGLLAEEITKQPLSEICQSVLENIYICYEPYVSTEVMPVLHALYESCYRPQCESLHRWLNQKALSSILIVAVDNDISEDGCSVETTEQPSSEISRTAVVEADISVSQEDFKTFQDILKAENESLSIFKKLKHITEATQCVEKTAMGVLDDASPVSTDDILDYIILLLQKLESEVLLKTYAHINLIRHLSPEFTEGHDHEYSLVSFFAAYQHLFDQYVLNKAILRVTWKVNRIRYWLVTPVHIMILLVYVEIQLICIQVWMIRLKM